MRSVTKLAEQFFYKVNSKSFLIVNNFYAAVTLVSVLGIVLSTVPALSHYEHIFIAIEYFTVGLFALEYIGRIIANRRNVSSYVLSFFGIIDLLAIVPTFASFTNLTFLKTARILRILLFLRMVRVAKVMRIPSAILKDPEYYAHYFYHVNIRIYFFALLSAIVIFASLIFAVEGEWNPVFASIPLSMIWTAKVIMGGVAQHMPQTIWGDLITIATRFTGLALFGLLISMIGNWLRRILFGSDTVDQKNRNHRRIRKIIHNAIHPTK
jgi:voltage-gated potassium channel